MDEEIRVNEMEETEAVEMIEDSCSSIPEDLCEDSTSLGTILVGAALIGAAFEGGVLLVKAAPKVWAKGKETYSNVKDKIQTKRAERKAAKAGKHEVVEPAPAEAPENSEKPKKESTKKNNNK